MVVGCHVSCCSSLVESVQLFLSLEFAKDRDLLLVSRTRRRVRDYEVRQDDRSSPMFDVYRFWVSELKGFVTILYRCDPLLIVRVDGNDGE